ncbi:hypothetical protein KKA14_16895 [bacterium]|nr:hypothetical protein [bacterium]
MAKDNSISDKNTTLSAMGDGFLEMRFDPKYKKIFQEKIESFNVSRTERSYDIPVEFSGRFDEKTRKVIQNLVNNVFLNAFEYDLKLKYTDPMIHFYTSQEWESQKGKSRNKTISLPASNIIWKENSPIIQLVIPEKISTGETAIKIVRLLLSKLFGKLFFDENVPAKKAFKLLPNQIEEKSFDRKEKAHFSRMLDCSSKSMLIEFEKISKRFSIRGPKAGEIGKKEFFKSFLQNDLEPDIEHVVLLESNFQELLNTAKENPEKFIGEVMDKIFNLIPQTNALLPHERKSYYSLKERLEPSLFDTLAERSQYLINTILEISECYDFLQAVDQQKRIDYAISDLWLNTLNERIKDLKKKGLVKLFLIEGSKLTSKQKRELNEFPLWIWRRRIFEHYPQTIKKENIIQRIIDQYKTSIFQRLFEAFFRLMICLKAMEKNSTLTFAKCPEFQRVKTLIAGLKIRIDPLSDILFTSKICSQLANTKNKVKINKEEILTNFEHGWSYFISFALIHQYYLHFQSKSNDNRSEQFLSVIEDYVKERIEDQLPFQITGLFLQMYKQKNFNLHEIVTLLKEDSQILDFFIMNQQSLFKNKANTATEVIEHYSDSIQQWQEQHKRYTIKKEELEKVTKAKHHS